MFGEMSYNNYFQDINSIQVFELYFIITFQNKVQMSQNDQSVQFFVSEELPSVNDKILEANKSSKVHLDESPQKNPQKNSPFKRKRQIRKENRKRVQKKGNVQTNTSIKGRPPNKSIENDFISDSRKFNDIVYHFSRLMIFLKLKQGFEPLLLDLQLENCQKLWMEQTENIMNSQNYPDLQQVKPTFLLHPNSLHYVFQHLKSKEGKSYYSLQEVKYMFLAFLKKRKILSNSVCSYVNAYWQDIINLINKACGSYYSEIQQKGEEIEEKHIEIGSDSASFQRKGGQKLFYRSLKPKEEQNLKKTNRIQRVTTQFQCLKNQLADDDSIAAYEIACYLYACCLRFQIRISSTS